MSRHMGMEENIPIAHKETIKCPKCGEIQTAIVLRTIPEWTYYHMCKGCGHEILKKEWKKLK